MQILYKKHFKTLLYMDHCTYMKSYTPISAGERGVSVVECRTPEREVRGSRPTSAVLCPWVRHFTPRKYWLITQEAMAPSRHDWKIVDWDVKPQHNQPTPISAEYLGGTWQQFKRKMNLLVKHHLNVFDQNKERISGTFENSILCPKHTSFQ